MSVCLSVESHFTSGVSVCRENAATYSASNKGQKFVVFSLKLLRCRDRALPLLDSHTYGEPIFLRITHMCIVHTQVLQGSRGCSMP